MPDPLSSLKVLDFSTLLPGPYASMILADLGAEVLRVESPTRTDLIRFMPPFKGKTSASHAYLNRNKKSIALNLKQPEAIDIIKKLVKEYDIVIEQFRPGVMDRLGIGYDTLSKINPSLIFCSITGYGQTGPYRDRAGHDINYLSLAGISSYSGYSSTGPSPLGIQIADIAGGSHYAVMGILAAINLRQLTQEGQYIDISMTDAAFSMNAMTLAGCLIDGKNPSQETEILNGGGFYGYYETKDGRYLSIGSLEPKFMSALCQALGRPELTSLGMSQRKEDTVEFKNILSQEIADKTLAEWQIHFEEIDACVEPVLMLDECLSHPHFEARELIQQVPGPDETFFPQVSNPIKFSTPLTKPKHIGCQLGEHSVEILQKLGYTEQEIFELKKNETIR